MYSNDDNKVYLLDLIHPPQCEEMGTRQSVHAAKAKRPLFVLSPKEREFDVRSKSGRLLSEIEIFHIKHHPEFEQLIPSIVDALNRIILLHKEQMRWGQFHGPEFFKQFETSQQPQILLIEYVKRIADHTYASPASILSAFILLDRLIKKFDLCITEKNVYKLLFVTIRVASKVIELRTLNNKNFASIGGITNKHLNELEALLVSVLEFDILISPLEFYRYASKLSSSCGRESY